MKAFRSFLFWLHLAAGLVAGTVIGIMSFTGVIIAFEHELVEWAERDVRRVEAPAPGAERLDLDALLTAARAAAGAEASIAGVTVTAGARDAVAVNFGRTGGTYYVNPYTAEVRRSATTAMHDFMHLMIDWHRWLALSGEQRAAGRAITGASNLAFLVLALTGLYLWWPRQWSRRVLRPALWFTGAEGRARDWNWHNVIGFWSLPVLVVLIVTAVVISYPWASNLVYRAVGEEPPVAGGPPSASTPELPTAFPAADGATPPTFQAAMRVVQQAHPRWTSITLREGLPRRRGAPPPATTTAATPAGASPTAGEGAGRARQGRNEPQNRVASAPPYSATVKVAGDGPAFASVQLVLHPYSGEILSRTGYADLSPGRKARSWMRYLHTGEALGWPGQLVAGLASLGGVILVYTGFALSWRRFFPRRRLTRVNRAGVGAPPAIVGETTDLSRR